MPHQPYDNYLCLYIIYNIFRIFQDIWATTKTPPHQFDNYLFFHIIYFHIFEQQLQRPLSNLTIIFSSISYIFFAVYFKIFEQQLQRPLSNLTITFSSILYLFFVGYFHIFEHQLQRPLSNLTEPRLCVVSCGVCLEHNVLHVAGAVTVRNA